MYWEYLGSFWNDFGDRETIENLWTTFQPYVDSVASYVDSVTSMLGASASVYSSKMKYVHETVDGTYINIDIKTDHGHGTHEELYTSNNVDISDATASSVEAVYINGQRIPRSSTYYSVSAITGGIRVSLAGTGYSVSDSICVHYITTGTGLHAHLLKSFDIWSDATTITAGTDNVTAVFVNGILYPEASWSVLAGVVTLSDAVGYGDVVHVFTYSTADSVNHYHEYLNSDYASLTVKVSAHFPATARPFINGVMSNCDANVYGEPPLDYYVIFSESFEGGYYVGDLIVSGTAKYKSKLSTGNIVYISGGSDAVYDANKSYEITGYTIRDGSDTWIYHDDEITADLYCDEVWYDNAIPYLLFGNKIDFNYDYVDANYARTLKALMAYRYRPKTYDMNNRLYCAIFNIPLNLVSNDIVSDISENDNGQTIIEMSSGAEYNVMYSLPVVAIGDTLDLLDVLCDAVDIDGFNAVIHHEYDSHASFDVIKNAVASPSAIRKIPSALYDVGGIDIYDTTWGWPMDGPYLFD